MYIIGYLLQDEWDFSQYFMPHIWDHLRLLQRPNFDAPYKPRGRGGGGGGVVGVIIDLCII